MPALASAGPHTIFLIDPECHVAGKVPFVLEPVIPDSVYLSIEILCKKKMQLSTMACPKKSSQRLCGGSALLGSQLPATFPGEGWSGERDRG